MRAGPRKGRLDIFGCTARVSSSSLIEEGEDMEDSEENEVLLLDDGDAEGDEEDADARADVEREVSMEGMGGNV